MKRVSVIACAVLFFRPPLTGTCMIGTVLALGGVLLYALVLDSEKKRDAQHQVLWRVLDMMKACVLWGRT